MVDGSGKRAIEEMGSVEEGWAQLQISLYNSKDRVRYRLAKYTFSECERKDRVKICNRNFYHLNVLLIIIKHIGLPYLGSKNSFLLCEIENQILKSNNEVFIIYLSSQ